MFFSPFTLCLSLHQRKRLPSLPRPPAETAGEPATALPLPPLGSPTGGARYRAADPAARSRQDAGGGVVLRPPVPSSPRSSAPPYPLMPRRRTRSGTDTAAYSALLSPGGTWIYDLHLCGASGRSDRLYPARAVAGEGEGPRAGSQSSSSASDDAHNEASGQAELQPQPTIPADQPRRDPEVKQRRDPAKWRPHVWRAWRLCPWRGRLDLPARRRPEDGAPCSPCHVQAVGKLVEAQSRRGTKLHAAAL